MAAGEKVDGKMAASLDGGLAVAQGIQNSDMPATVNHHLSSIPVLLLRRQQKWMIKPKGG